MDTIAIHGLRLDTVVGCLEWERQLAQTIELNLELGLPATRPSRSDRIADTIDYAGLVAGVRAALADTRFALLERLCEHVADTVLQAFPAAWVRVSAAKLGVLPGVRRVEVTVERTRA